MNLLITVLLTLLCNTVIPCKITECEIFHGLFRETRNADPCLEILFFRKGKSSIVFILLLFWQVGLKNINCRVRWCHVISQKSKIEFIGFERSIGWPSIKSWFTTELNNNKQILTKFRFYSAALCITCCPNRNG